MAKIRVVVKFNGEWEKQDLQYIYNGGNSKGIVVPHDISHANLMDKIYEVTNIDRVRHEIKLKFTYNLVGASELLQIDGDNDLSFFFDLNIDRGMPGTALCISTIERDHVDATRPDSPFGVPLEEDDDHINSTEFGFSDDNEPDPLIDSSPSSPLLVNVQADENAESESIQVPRNGNVDSNAEGFAQTRKTRLSTATSDEVDEVVGVLQVGEMFVDKKSLYKKICMNALELNFQFKVIKSTKSLLVLGCITNECKWRLRATIVKNTSFFVIKRFITTHLSSLCFMQQHHRQANSWVIGDYIKSKYEGVSCIYRPKDIIADFQRIHGVSIDYYKAWRARESALNSLYGSPEESFAQLPSFFSNLESKNPGTITHILSDSENRFKYSFMALGPSLRGFRSCMRRVICVDGTFLKGKYLGTLLIATCLDGNNQVYPLSFGVADSENEHSWTWYFEKLRGAIGNVTNLVIISDRNKAIEKAVAHVLPEAVHGSCIYHISQNVRAKKFSDGAIPLYMKAAKAYRERDFQHLMNLVRGFDDGKVYTYLEGCDFKKWARCYFPGNRYNVMTTNIAECLNSVLQDARCLPITKLMEFLRALIQRWFYERREAALEMNNILTTHYEKVAAIRLHKSRTMNVIPISVYQFNVGCGDARGVVDLVSKTCSCKVWDIDQMPCVHAIAACRERTYMLNTLWSPYYTTEMLLIAYAEAIIPLPNEKDWDIVEGSNVLLPPSSRRPGGRPRKRRVPSSGEATKKRICSRCKQDGHNRQTCKNPIALHPTGSTQDIPESGAQARTSQTV